MLPAFGDKKVDELEADEIRNWHRGIAKTPARARTRKPAPSKPIAPAIWTSLRRNASGKHPPIAV